MSKAVKGMMIDTIIARLGSNSDMLVLDTSKMNALADNKLRAKARKKGITLLQVKNSLVRRALGEAGAASLKKSLAGPSTLVWGGEDVVALSKEITQWAKEIKTLTIKGGTVGGVTLDPQGVDSLSKSPGRAELLSIIAGQILSPAGRVAGALLGVGGTICGQVKSIADKEPETKEPETKEATDAAPAAE